MSNYCSGAGAIEGILRQYLTQSKFVETQEYNFIDHFGTFSLFEIWIYSCPPVSSIIAVKTILPVKKIKNVQISFPDEKVHHPSIHKL